MTPDELLGDVYREVEANPTQPAIVDPTIAGRIDFVVRCQTNRAGVRLLMACLLAKLDRPEVDPRQPYTEIGGDRCFSGRVYDERYITSFIMEHALPCNSTTAFLTPALRNINRPLALETVLVGSPRRLYTETLQLLDDVARETLSARDALTEAIRVLVLIRDERAARMASLLHDLASGEGALPLSSEAIVTLIEQHLACRNASRLPVLLVAAAYQVASKAIGEHARPLKPHTAADEQTGALGDVEVCLINDDRVVTTYEMKSRRITIDDIDRAVQKVVTASPRIDNYIFITTQAVDDEVLDHARTMYDRTGGTEFAVLDCLGFVRHFLHLFHRSRMEFLNAYQAFVLAEPVSAVRQPLKEALLSLRQAAESE